MINEVLPQRKEMAGAADHFLREASDYHSASLHPGILHITRLMLSNFAG
jgi:hypothetical protein